MKSTILAALAVLFCLNALNAQVNYETAQIILANGKKLNVEVKKDLDTKLANGIEYRKNESSPVIMLKPGEIRSIQFDNGQIWETVQFVNPLDSNKTSTVLGKYLVKGKYKLFSIPIYQSQHYLLISPDENKFYLYNDDIRPNGERLRTGNYVDGLAQVSATCTDMKGRAEKTSYGDREIANYVADLNRCVGFEPEVFYVKPATEVNLMVFGGGMFLGQDKFEGFGQFIVRFRKPELSRKVSLNTGLNLSYFRGQETDELYNLPYNSRIWYLSIPLTVQYNFLEKKFQPFLNAGVSMLFRQKTTSNPFIVDDNSFKASIRPAFILSVGAEWNVSDQVFVKGEWRYEYYTHYPFVGIGYKF
jgi:opacity protein-like surface antigen